MTVELRHEPVHSPFGGSVAALATLGITVGKPRAMRGRMPAQGPSRFLTARSGSTAPSI
jgi:hypothetical protein